MYTEKPTQKPQNIELIKVSKGVVALVEASPTSPKKCPAIAESISEYASVNTPDKTSGKPNVKKVLKIFPLVKSFKALHLLDFFLDYDYNKRKQKCQKFSRYG